RPRADTGIGGRPGDAAGAEGIAGILPYTRIVLVDGVLDPTPLAASANEAAVGDHGHPVGFSTGPAAQFQAFSFGAGNVAGETARTIRAVEQVRGRTFGCNGARLAAFALVEGNNLGTRRARAV